MMSFGNLRVTYFGWAFVPFDCVITKMIGRSYPIRTDGPVTVATLAK